MKIAVTTHLLRSFPDRFERGAVGTIDDLAAVPGWPIGVTLDTAVLIAGLLRRRLKP